MNPLHQVNGQSTPSIKSLLLNTESQKALRSAGLSQTEIEHFQQAITPLSCTFTKDVTNILGIAGSEPVWGRSRRIDKHYPYNYQSISLCLVLALLHSKRALLALYDTPQGAIVVAKLAFDMLSWPGILSFGIIDEGGSVTHLISTSVIKGQFVDYGKGKKALDQVLGELEMHLNRFKVSSPDDTISYEESLPKTQAPPQQSIEIIADNVLPTKAEVSESSEDTSRELPLEKADSLPAQTHLSETETPHPLLDPPMRYVLRPLLNIRVPAYMKADQESEIFEYLEPDAVVDVVWKNQLWLCIQRSPGQYAYIKERYARPFQSMKWKEEAQHVASFDSTTRSYSSTNSTNNIVIAKRWFLLSGVSFVLGLVVFFIAAIVASVEERACIFIFCSTTHPFTQQAQALNVLGYILLGIGVITFLIGLAVRSS